MTSCKEWVDVPEAKPPSGGYCLGLLFYPEDGSY
jgi:hypothetical protein